MQAPVKYILPALVAGLVALSMTPDVTAQASNGEAPDTIRTTSGVVFRGKVTEQGGEKVTIVTDSGPVDVPRAIIEEMVLAGEQSDEPVEDDIPEVEVPPGEADDYVEKAGELYKQGEFKQAIGHCKGLVAVGSELSDEQRAKVGKVAGGAYFEIGDWPAAARSLRYAARAHTSETDRKRVEAVAEALTENEAPNIGGQTAGSFQQARSLAMKWKADQIFETVRDALAELKDTHQRPVVERAYEAAEQSMAETDVYVPGYSLERFPETLRAGVERMLDRVEKATGECDKLMVAMLENYNYKFAGRDEAKKWNVVALDYLKTRQASRECLDNAEYVEEEYPLRKAYDDNAWKAYKDRYTTLANKVEELKYYPQNADGRFGKIKGKRVRLARF